MAWVYVPCQGTRVGNDERGRAADQRPLNVRLTEVRTAINTKCQRRPGPEVFVAGDFDRHDFQWGGYEVVHEPQQGEAEGILDFIAESKFSLSLSCHNTLFPCSQSPSLSCNSKLRNFSRSVLSALILCRSSSRLQSPGSTSYLHS